jgi:hypothetical protein
LSMNVIDVTSLLQGKAIAHLPFINGTPAAR